MRALGEAKGMSKDAKNRRVGEATHYVERKQVQVGYDAVGEVVRGPPAPPGHAGTGGSENRAGRKASRL